ncbi:MAG: hypothetical protein U5L72_19000 [Bacteroidales bacterium]|nr:hypothetical protein [Bacteroidales bacterium]
MDILADAMKGNRPPKGTSGRTGPKEIDLHLKPAQAVTDVIERQITRFRGELEGAIRRGERGENLPSMVWAAAG